MDRREGNPLGEEKENKAIHTILLKILDKWQAEIQKGTKDVLEETVVISSEASQRGTSPPRPKEIEEALDKTVILSPQGIARREESPPAHRPEEISETVILTPQRTNREYQSPITGSAGGEKTPPAPPSKEDQFSEETVILKPGKMRGKTNG
jgi:hypothetical protein